MSYLPMPMYLHRTLLALLWALVLAGLQACSPEYNWRETTVADGNAQIAFPSRVRTEERPINVDGVSLTFSLTSASVGEAVFAVGFIKLPPDTPEAFSQSLSRRLVSSLNSTGKPMPEEAYNGDVFELDTRVAGKASRLVGRVVLHRDVLIQVVASGPTAELGPEQAGDFMRSLVLR